MSKHKPVLLKEVIDALEVKDEGVYVDATLGGGGHSKEVLQSLKKGKLVAFDFDAESIKEFEKHLLKEGFVKKKDWLRKKNLKIALVHDNFKEINEVLKKLKLKKVDGIIADFGLSTDQYEKIEGVSYLRDEPLDMRIDKSRQTTAADLLNALYKKELLKLFEALSDIKFADELVREIIYERKLRPFKTTKQLKRIIQKVVPYHKRKGAFRNPDAKVFQALRIAVNDELGSIRQLLPLALETLAPEGKLAVITFHSGEDRIVKKFINQGVADNLIKEKSTIIKPTEIEKLKNPRSSSAKLRIIIKN